MLERTTITGNFPSLITTIDECFAISLSRSEVYFANDNYAYMINYKRSDVANYFVSKAVDYVYLIKSKNF